MHCKKRFILNCHLLLMIVIHEHIEEFIFISSNIICMHKPLLCKLKPNSFTKRHLQIKCQNNKMKCWSPLFGVGFEHMNLICSCKMSYVAHWGWGATYIMHHSKHFTKSVRFFCPLRQKVPIHFIKLYFSQFLASQLY